MSKIPPKVKHPLKTPRNETEPRKVRLEQIKPNSYKNADDLVYFFGDCVASYEFAPLLPSA